MALMVLGFLAVMAASFGAVVMFTRPSQEQQTIAQRMALIQLPEGQQDLDILNGDEFFKTAKKSSFPWLDELLEPTPVAKSLQRLILQAESSSTVAGLILTTVGLFFAGYAVTWIFVSMVLVDVAGGLVLSLLPYLILHYKRSRRVKAFNEVLAEAIDMLSRALRAGHSVSSGLEMLTESAQEPLASEFREVFREVNLGLPMRGALLQLLERVPSPDLQVLVTAILVQKDTGGNLAEILDRTVFVIRERLRIQGEIQTQTAQGRLTGWILSSLPVVMMVLLNLVNPGYSRILFHDPLGRKLLYGSAGMLALGAFFIRQIINGIEV